MKNARDILFSCKNIYDQEGTKNIFVQAVKENIRHHQTHCTFYEKLLKQRNFNEDGLQTPEDCADIPVIPAAFFKYHEVLSVQKSAVEIHATSSGTQGQKSQMFFDSATIGAGVRMVTNMMRHFGFISFIPANYIMLGYEPSDTNEMGSAKTAMGITRFAPALRRVFVLRATKEGYAADRFGVLDSLLRFEKQGWPVRFVGFPSYFYFLLKQLRDEGIRVKLNRHSLALLGGGWKQFDGVTIDKIELYAMAEELLGMPSQNCRDFYSAVEHSVAYGECPNHHLHVPIWSRVFIRDVKTLIPLGYEKPGFLSFVTPLVTSAPLTSIMMGDLAMLHEGKKCGCGIDTPYFEVLGRAGVSRMRNCAVAASEWMGGT